MPTEPLCPICASPLTFNGDEADDVPTWCVCQSEPHYDYPDWAEDDHAYDMAVEDAMEDR